MERKNNKGTLTAVALEYVDAQNSTIEVLKKYKEQVAMKTSVSKIKPH